MSVAGNSGACCECSQLTGCDCITLVPSTLACQSKSGSADLCGYPEWTDPSNPVRRYRKVAMAGAVSGKSTPAVDCDETFACFTVETYGGSCQKNKDTCALSGALTLHIDKTGTGGAICPGEGDSNPSCDAADINSLFEGAGVLDPVFTRTQISLELHSGSCVNGTISGPSSGVSVFSATKTLSDEDTEDDAEKRAAAAITDWSNCTGGCSVLCSAFRTDRSGTSDTVFGFRIVQAKAQWTAGIGGHSYTVKTRFYRRVLGTGGPYLFFGLDERTLTFTESVATAVETPWIDVPNEAGWETIAGGQTVELIS